MLAHITVDRVKRIAQLAKEARMARDEALKVEAEALGEPPPARGEHDLLEVLGYDPLPADHPALAALRDEITAVDDEARHELRALALVGRGDYAAADWDKAVAAAALELPDTAIGALMDEVNLHNLLMKALYELKLASA